MELPSEPRMRWLLRTVARLHAGGAEPVAGLVLPTAEFFPDVFDRSRASLERLLARIQSHAGLADLAVELVIAGDEEALGSGCSSGACAPSLPAGTKLQRVAVAGDGYRVTLAPAETGHPTVLSTVLVRAVAHIFMLEAELYEDFDPAEGEALVDVAGTLLGFGVLLCNGAYIYSKGCGGVRVASATRLGVEELALALAIHCGLHDVPVRTASRHLDATARALFDEAAAWAQSNRHAVALAASDPAAVEADSYALNEARGWLSRLFGLGRAKGPSAPDDAELERLAKRLKPQRQRDEARAARLAALSELVDEALE